MGTQAFPIPTGEDILWWGLVVSLLIVILFVGMVIILDRLKNIKGNVKIGPAEYNGRAGLDVRLLIKNVVALEVERHSLQQAWVDMCRDKVRTAARWAVNRMKAHIRVAIQDYWISKGEPKIKSDEWRDYSSIADLSYYKIMEIGMQSVENNHYAEKNEMEFDALVNDVFAQITMALDNMLIELWDESNDMTAAMIIEAGKPLMIGSRDKIRGVLLECRHYAIEKNKKAEQLGRSIDQIVSGGADTIEGGN